MANADLMPERPLLRQLRHADLGNFQFNLKILSRYGVIKVNTTRHSLGGGTISPRGVKSDSLADLISLRCLHPLMALSCDRVVGEFSSRLTLPVSLLPLIKVPFFQKLSCDLLAVLI